jgi:hypothetical protein
MWFIENFTKIASPLFKLLTKDSEFFWNILCQTSFETLKEKISIALVLRGPNWSLPFHISIDASNNEGELVHVDDNFPHEHLFAISTNFPIGLKILLTTWLQKVATTSLT